MAYLHSEREQFRDAIDLAYAIDKLFYQIGHFLSSC